jgi:transcriptional regulator GlxA family with amidase domain
MGPAVSTAHRSTTTLRRHFRHTLATTPDVYRRTFTTAPAGDRKVENT